MRLNREVTGEEGEVCEREVYMVQLTGLLFLLHRLG